MNPRGPTSDDRAHQFVGNRVDGLTLAAGQVQLLDPVGDLAEPVSGGQVVVEVAAFGAHSADVERQLRFDPRQPVIDVVADGHRRVHHHVHRAERGIPFGGTGGQRLTPDRRGLLRMEEDRLPALGDLGGQLDVLRAQRRDRYRNTFAHRMIDELQRLCPTRSAVRGQRELIVLAVVVHPFPAPHLPADLHHLAGAAQRGVELDAVKPLDDLRSGRADPQAEPAVGHEVQTRGGHRQQRRRADVDGEHPRGQFDGAGLGGQIPELADGVEGIRLGHHHDVDAGLLELDDAVHGFFEAARVIQGDPDSHNDTLSTHPGGCAGSRYFSSATIFSSRVTGAASGSSRSVLGRCTSGSANSR